MALAACSDPSDLSDPRDPAGDITLDPRSPAGEVSPAEDLGFSNSIELLGSDGEIVFLNSTDRYRAPVGGPAVKIGTWLGDPIYIDGQLHVMIGSALLRVD